MSMRILKTIYHLNGHSRDPTKTMPNPTSLPHRKWFYFLLSPRIVLLLIRSVLMFHFFTKRHIVFSDQLTSAMTLRTNQIIMFLAKTHLVHLLAKVKMKLENKKCLAYFNYCPKVSIEIFSFNITGSRALQCC